MEFGSCGLQKDKGFEIALVHLLSHGYGPFWTEWIGGGIFSFLALGNIWIFLSNAVQPTTSSLNQSPTDENY